MSLAPGVVEQLLDIAQRLVEPVSGLREHLQGHLEVTGSFLDFPSAPAPDIPAAFVDGAVADEQTDALVWVTAAGVAQTAGRGDHTETASTVAPVSGDTDRLRSALMATCELSAATAWDDRMVFMDGGLATPLISVAQGVTVGDPDVEASIAHRYREVDVVGVVNTYLDRLLDGQIVALPKQDTATGYVERFRAELRRDLTDAQRHALGRMRDRSLIGGVLQPGQMLRPRPAAELVRTDVKAPDGHEGAAALSSAYARLRDATGVHVAYFKPTRLPTRVIKMEYLERDIAGFADGLTLAAALDAQTLGPRMKEPLMQHQVDVAAKRVVTANLSSITGTAARALDNPAATSHYRT